MPVRLRRTKSISLAQVEGENLKERRLRATLPDQPIHKQRDSLLSSSSGYTNYRGFLNLCIILLVLSNARLVLENIMKYGILVDPIQWANLFINNPTESPSVLLLFSLLIFPLSSLGIEKLLANGFIGEMFGFMLVVILLIIELTAPPVIVYLTNCQAVAASIVLGYVSVVFLKLVSYHMVNFWCRESLSKKVIPDKRIRRRSVSSDRQRKDMMYYLFAPTLCYELNFPRSSRIRKRFLVKRVLEMVFLIQIILCLLQQWVVPTINNSFKPLQEMDYFRMIERLLKLAIPNHFIWLLLFYWLFHSSLNVVAEILKFGDRHFYNDWWNSETVDYFWQNWNIPVHKWCVRHLYKPMLRFGFTRRQAAIAVFFVSAFFHEYLVSVPLKMFKLWAFFGMLAQLPFSIVVEKYFHNQYGNVAVWISLLIGQPLCILMYYHDYYVINFKTADV
ncbi:diacylglycerol O-acyltransferase 1 isoform X2 [Parasteatoda tepidariorum]|uniref:diacylglycerol O-acyltransferase 1 isoform X2 n=1 Tax=Parasteatoda tepidariorum TaxID=114398 RepID=UPI0039BD47ED